MKKRHGIKRMISCALTAVMLTTSIPGTILGSDAEVQDELKDSLYVSEEELSSAPEVIEQEPEVQLVEESVDGGSEAGGTADLLSDGSEAAAVSSPIEEEKVTESGLKIQVSVPEDVLPEGTVVEVADVPETEMEALTAQIVEDLDGQLAGEVVKVLAADIFFKKDEISLVPGTNVKVTMIPGDEAKAELKEKEDDGLALSLVYVPAEGEAAVVAEEKIHEKTLEGITFETTLFPRYAIVATVEAAEETEEAVESAQDEVKEAIKAVTEAAEEVKEETAEEPTAEEAKEEADELTDGVEEEALEAAGEAEEQEQISSAKVEGVRSGYYTIFTAELTGAKVTASVPYYFVSNGTTMEVSLADTAEYESIIARANYGKAITDLKAVEIRFADRRGRRTMLFSTGMTVELSDTGAEKYVMYEPYRGWYGTELYQLGLSRTPKFNLYSYSDSYVFAGLKSDGINRVSGVTKRGKTSFALTTADGTAVEAAAAKGAFSGTTYMEVEDANTAETKALAEAALAEKGETLNEVVKAFDIAFHTADGGKIEPKADVTVSIKTPLTADATYQMVHIKDDGTTEILDEDSVSFSENGATFIAKDFSTYIIAETVVTVDFLTADGKTLKVKVAFDEKEVIPVGAKLVIDEETYDEDARAKRNLRMANVLNEEYGNVIISDVRYLDISIMVDGEEFQPQYPVELTVAYDEILNTDNTIEYGLGEESEQSEMPEPDSWFVAIHYKENDESELLESSTVKTEDGIAESTILTSGFSEYDLAYVYELYAEEPGRDYDLSNLGLLAENKVLLGETKAGQKDGETVEPVIPDHEKHLSPNGDGTYIIDLSVTGSATTTSEIPDTNVIIVYDVSSSMRYHIPMTYGGSYSTGIGRYERLYQDTQGTQAEDGYQGTVYTRTQTGNWWDPQYSYTIYTGQRYSNTTTRAMAGEKVLYDFTHALFSYKNGDDATNIQAALVTFSGSATTTQGWTSTETDITNKVSNTGTSTKLTYTRGTNWEAALATAYSLINGDDNNNDDPTYVVFITDGAPTSHGNGTGTDVARYLTDTFGQNYEYALNESKLVQDKCKATKGSLFSIYAFGTEADWLASLMYYAYNGTRPDPEGEYFATEGYYSAADSNALTDAMSDIFSRIVETLGVGSAKITDGTTSDVTTTTGEIADLLDVDDSSYQYWLSWPVTRNGNGTYSFTMIDPVSGDNINYTATVDGDTVTLTWNIDGTDRSATYTGSVSAGNILKVQWTNGNNFYNKTPPAASFSNKSVVWNLNSVGTLLDGVTYTVSFECYPSQYTLDLIADLKNGYAEYNNLDANIRKYLLKEGDNYTLLTNTQASLTYKDTRASDEEQTASYTNPDPVNTGAAERVAVSKEWENSIDERVKTGLELKVTRDDEERYTVPLNEQNHWQNNVWISFGIMTVRSNGTVTLKTTGHDYAFVEPPELQHYWELETAPVRPMIINNVETLLVKIENEEEVPDGIKSISTNGTAAVDGVTYYKLTINSTPMYYKVVDSHTTLKATNYRRSVLDVVKKLEKGIGLSENTEFTFNMAVVNSRADKGTAGNPDTDKYVWFSIVDKNGTTITERDIVTVGDEGSEKFGYEYSNGTQKEYVFDNATAPEGYSFNGYYFVESGTEIHVQMKADYSLRFINLPEGSTYTVGEALTPEQQAAGYVLSSITGERTYTEKTTTTTIDESTGEETETTTSTKKTESAGRVDNQTKSISGTIDYADSEYKVTVTNGCEKFYVYHSGAKKANGDVILEVIPIPQNVENFTYDLTEKLSKDTLYGGYYYDYKGKGEYKDDGIEKPGHTAYNGVNYSWSSPEKETLGNAIKPVAGETYYIKEVPQAYLQNYCHYQYVIDTGLLTSLYLVSAIDDANYKETGFVLTKTQKETISEVRVTRSLTFRKNGTPTYIITPFNVFENKGMQQEPDAETEDTKKDDYITYWKTTTDYFCIGTFKMRPYWITPDGITVDGITTRTVKIDALNKASISATEN